MWQMDKNWIRGSRRPSSENTNGVDDFMQFVRRSVAQDADTLCLCRLNRV